jgi:hypothetical protein
VDGINIKLEKCGSLREALRMVHVARAHHLKVMMGCMLCSTLGHRGGHADRAARRLDGSRRRSPAQHGSVPRPVARSTTERCG